MHNEDETEAMNQMVRDETILQERRAWRAEQARWYLHSQVYGKDLANE